MHRLIIDAVEPLNTQFCEALVAVLGECAVIPLTENYCAVEGFKMDCTEYGFQRLLAFLQVHTERTCLTSENIGFDSNLRFLEKCPQNALLSTVELPEIFFWHRVKMQEKLWCIIPWETLNENDF